jgi:hypothetical protein
MKLLNKVVAVKKESMKISLKQDINLLRILRAKTQLL